MITIYGEIKPIDVLAIGVHPDDVELACSATVAKLIHQGYTVGIADLTKGELGSRGSASIRMKEATAAAEILHVDFRVNLEMRDGFFQRDELNLMKVIRMIRLSAPKMILANSIEDRHPDHGRAAKLVADAFFYSGLRRIECDGLAEHRADRLYHYIQDKNLTPDFCVDVTGYEQIKKKAILAFGTQFYKASDDSDEPQTPISSASFMDFLDAKMRVFGRSIGVEYAEGFNVNRVVGVDDLMSLI